MPEVFIKCGLENIELTGNLLHREVLVFVETLDQPGLLLCILR